MKSITLINPEKAYSLIVGFPKEFILQANRKASDYFIKGNGLSDDELLVSADMFKNNISAISLKVCFGVEYDISLEDYGNEISLELKDIADLGALLLINNEPYLLRVYQEAEENSLIKIGASFPSLRFADFGSAGNGNIKTLDGIASCKQLHTLNLDNCSRLNDISKLPQLRGLKTLYLDGYRDTTQFHFISECLGLEVLSQNSSDLTSLEHLSGLNKLKLLQVGSNENLVDLSPLSGLSALTDLYLGSCENICDLRPLSNLRALKNLNLISCVNLVDLRSLSSLIALKYLNLESCESIIDISPLSGLINLTKLNLNWCTKIFDFDPIKGLSNLRNLNLSFFSISDFSFLSGMGMLEQLNIQGCSNFTDLSPLSNLSNLTNLKLSHNERLDDLGPISKLVGLTSLDISGCENINNLSPISDLVYLINLDLSYCNKIRDIESLSFLTNLKELVLTNLDSLSNLSPLSGLINLTYLNLYGCQGLSDLSPLSGLINLTNLNLGSCSSLNDFGPIAGLSNLTRLRLWEYSNLPDIVPLAGLSNLQSLEFRSCENLTRVYKINRLPRLKLLDLGDCPNIRDFDRLASLPQIRDLKWIDAVACNEILMSSAYYRKDVGFVKSRSAQWIKELPLSKDALLFTSRLLNCISLLEASERNSLLLDVCKAMRARGLQSELLNDLDAYTWETWCNLVLELDAAQPMACLHEASSDLDIKRETEVLLGPVIVAASEFIQKHSTEKEKTIIWVNEQLLQLEIHPEEQRQIAPSAAVFFASLNKRDDVLFWLQKATDAKAPLWRERVLHALVKHYAHKENFTEARQLLDEMHIQDEKDHAIAALAQAMAASNPVEAGVLLDEIQEANISSNSARKLLQQPSMLLAPQGIYQVLLHLQSNPDELASALEIIIERDTAGSTTEAVKQLFIQTPASGPSAAVLLELCKHPSIADFVKPRALEKYKSELQDRVNRELSQSVPHLIAEMQNAALLEDDEAQELTILMQTT